MILPRPYKENFKNSKLSIGSQIVFSGEDSLYADKFISEFINNSSFCEKAETIPVELVKDTTFDDEEYKIIVNNSVKLYYSKQGGLRNCLSSLVQLIDKVDDIFYVEKCEIEDKPDCKFRSVLIDLARGLPQKTRLFEDIKRLALFKCNYLHLHLFDAEGTCYQSDVIDFNWDINGTKRITKQELKEIVDYAQFLGLECIPEIEIPSHASGLWGQNEKIRCKTNLEDPSPATVCAGNDYTYEFYESIIKELLDIFNSKYFHVGGDEIMFEDYPDWNYFCHWEQCEVCKAVMEKEHLNGWQDMYYYLMRRMHDILEKYGKTMILWGDELDVSKPIPLQKDVVIQFWQSAAPGRGPWKNCNYANLLKQGFNVINSHVQYAYIDKEIYFNPERCSGFIWNENPENDECCSNVIGSEVCAWDYGNPENIHYLTSFPFSTALFLDRLWNKNFVVYSKGYRKTLTKTIFGMETPDNFDVCELFGSVVPPRENGVETYSTVENELFRKGQIEPIYNKLKEIRNTYSPILLNRIIKVFGERPL